jgi:hypothetical protein
MLRMHLALPLKPELGGRRIGQQVHVVRLLTRQVAHMLAVMLGQALHCE